MLHYFTQNSIALDFLSVFVLFFTIKRVGHYAGMRAAVYEASKGCDSGRADGVNTSQDEENKLGAYKR